MSGVQQIFSDLLMFDNGVLDVWQFHLCDSDKALLRPLRDFAPGVVKLLRPVVRVRARCPRLSQIHFVDLSVKCAAADAEFLRSGSDVAIRRSKRLSNQSSFGLVKVERAGLFAEGLGW